jgi:hypothetical protein
MIGHRSMAADKNFLFFMNPSSSMRQQRYISTSSVAYSSSKTQDDLVIDATATQRRWTKEEDAELIRLAQMANKLQTWKGLPLPKGRSLFACSERARMLQKRQGENNAPVIRNQQLWTAEDKQLIVDLVTTLKRSKVPWAYIHERFFLDRTRDSLRSCWYKTIKPSLDKGEIIPSTTPPKEVLAFVEELNTKAAKKSTIWTDEEDACLTAAVQKHGTAWQLISDTAFDSINYQNNKTIQPKTSKQCANRWQGHLNPDLSRESLSDVERSRLRELVIQMYLEHDPTLDIDAIISGKKCWPAEIPISFTKVSQQLAKEGLKRPPARYAAEWENRTDPAIRTGEWSQEEMDTLTKIMRNGGTFREAGLQLHRSASYCRQVWNRISGDYDLGPLSCAEQLTFLTALSHLGRFHNRTIRKDYLPCRLSTAISHYWRDHELRIQKTVFDYCKADASTRQTYGGKDNEKFAAYFSELKLKKKDLKVIVSQLQKLERIK